MNRCFFDPPPLAFQIMTELAEFKLKIISCREEYPSD